MNRVLDAFDEVLGRNNLEVDESLSGNDLIENTISNLYENQDHESFIDVITAICFCIMNDGQGWVPFVTVSGEMFQNLDASTLQEGDRLTLDQDCRKCRFGAVNRRNVSLLPMIWTSSLMI